MRKPPIGCRGESPASQLDWIVTGVEELDHRRPAALLMTSLISTSSRGPCPALPGVPPKRPLERQWAGHRGTRSAAGRAGDRQRVANSSDAPLPSTSRPAVEVIILQIDHGQAGLVGEDELFATSLSLPSIGRHLRSGAVAAWKAARFSQPPHSPRPNSGTLLRAKSKSIPR